MPPRRGRPNVSRPRSECGGLHVVRNEALGNHYQRRTATVVGFLDPFSDLFDACLLLRNQDGVGPPGCHAGMQGDPTDVAAHDFGDHAAVMGFAGGSQPVDGLSGDLDSGIETEGVISGVKVVVHGLGGRQQSSGPRR